MKAAIASGQARLLREADHRRRRERSRDRPACEGRGRQERRRAGQAVPARAAQATGPGRRGLLRTDPVGSRRVRLLGVRRPRASDAAPVLELSTRRRRRDHRRHVLPLALRADDVFGPLRSVFALGATHVPERVDEEGRRYACTAEDAVYGTFRAGRRRRRPVQLVVVHAGQPRRAPRAPRRRDRRKRRRRPPRLPRPGPRRDAARRLEPRPSDQIASGRVGRRFRTSSERPNGFKAQWELFLRHVVLDEPFPWDFLAGARGIQLAELGMRSWAEGCLVDVPPLGL